jgi:hypothetical protein
MFLDFYLVHKDIVHIRKKIFDQNHLHNNKSYNLKEVLYHIGIPTKNNNGCVEERSPEVCHRMVIHIAWFMLSLRDAHNPGWASASLCHKGQTSNSLVVTQILREKQTVRVMIFSGP